MTDLRARALAVLVTDIRKSMARNGCTAAQSLAQRFAAYNGVASRTLGCYQYGGGYLWSEERSRKLTSKQAGVSRLPDGTPCLEVFTMAEIERAALLPDTPMVAPPKQLDLFA